MTNRYDVLIVGGGAMGSSAAWWLARRGRSVCLLEQFHAGHDRGSSHGSSRVFRLVYPDPRYARLAQRALPMWRGLERDSGIPLLTLTGGVDHGDRLDIPLLSAVLHRQGTPYQVLTAQQASDRWPNIRFLGPVLYQPDAGRIDADAAVAALQGCATAHGAELRFGEPVQHLSVRPDGVTAATTGGNYRAPTAIIAAGAWTATLLADLVDLPPLTVVQSEVFHFPTDPCATWPTFNHEHQSLSMYGLGTATDGVKVAQHRVHGPITTADTRSHIIDPHIRAAVAQYVRKWLPGLQATALSEKTCLYTMTPTEDFLIDRRGPLIVNSSCSGHGFKFAPLIGRMIADLAMNEDMADPQFAFPADAHSSHKPFPTGTLLSEREP